MMKKSSKKVLIIAYYFPPMGMGGVQRITKLVKYLPEFEWDPLVLTVKDVSYYARDESFLNEVKERKIIRTGSFDPLRLKWFLENKWRNKDSYSKSQKIRKRPVQGIQSWILQPDTKILWIPFAWRQSLKTIQSEKIDLIMTTSPPHSAHILGMRLKYRTGLPWVADFRDNWLREPFEKHPTRFHREWNQRMVRKVVQAADRLIGVSTPIVEDLRIVGEKESEACHVILNGYDSQDFIDCKRLEPERFTITYCGTLSAIRHPGIFLKGVSQALRSHPEIKKKLKIQFVGSSIDINLGQIITDYGLQDVVNIVGYVSHKKSIQYLMESSLLLLLVSHDFSEGVVTGKIFEYLASGKPILGLVRKGAAEEMILKYKRGIVIPPDDYKSVAVEIVRSLELWERGDLKIETPDLEGVEILNRRDQAKQVADIFEGLVYKTVSRR
jgi:glycosyltransferase involved in cell wall biosynthesis